MEQAITTRIIDFLQTNASVISLNTLKGREAFLYLVVSDSDEFYREIDFLSEATNIFISLLIKKLEKDEWQGKRKGVIVAVLEKTKSEVDEQQRNHCAELLQAWALYCKKRSVSNFDKNENGNYECDTILLFNEKDKEKGNDRFLWIFKKYLSDFYGFFADVFQRTRSDERGKNQGFGKKMFLDSHTQTILNSDGTEPEDYKYDIFLSYPEEYAWWVKNIFLQQFQKFLKHFLNRRARIFSIQENESWSSEVESHLKYSRCLVPIWDPVSFESTWWKYGCSIMLQRETHLRQIKPEQPIRLILPVIVNDCESYSMAQAIPKQYKLDDIIDYVSDGAGIKDTPIYIDFQFIMKNWVKMAVSATIKHTPWRDEWLHIQADMTMIPDEPISNSEKSKQTYYAILRR